MNAHELMKFQAMVWLKETKPTNEQIAEKICEAAQSAMMLTAKKIVAQIESDFKP